MLKYDYFKKDVLVSQRSKTVVSGCCCDAVLKKVLKKVKARISKSDVHNYDQETREESMAITERRGWEFILC